MQIQMGNQVELAVLAEAFNTGFQDYRYATTFTPEGMANFLERSGIDQANCAVLTEASGTRGLGMALLALNGDRAWCGGLAVAPECRRDGWATRLMDAIERQAVQRGALELSLEVLTDNVPAGTLYARLGYRRCGELLIWERAASEPLPSNPEPRHRSAGGLTPSEPAHILCNLAGWHTDAPCWQRTPAFLSRQLSKLEGYLAANAQGEQVGYILLRSSEAATGAPDAKPPQLRIVDLAVHPSRGKQGANYLVQLLSSQFGSARLSLLNEPKESLFSAPLSATGFQVVERQYELKRRIG